MTTQSQMDIGIIVPLQEEFRQLHALLPVCTPVKDEPTGHYDYLFEHSSSSGAKYRCAASFVGEMGPENAAVATEQFLARRHPHTLVVLGIAGGIDKDVRLGDVVAATYVNNYLTRAKAVPDGAGKFEFELAGRPYSCTDPLLQCVRNLEFAHPALFQTWGQDGETDLQKLIPERKLKRLLAKEFIRPKPIFLDAPIASGPVVSAAEEFVHWLKKNNRTYYALEMESGAALTAVYSHLDPAKTIVLRGISDFGDQRKRELDAVGNGGLRAYAMNNAVRLLWRLLDADLLPQHPDTPKPPVSEHPPEVFTSKLPTISGELFGRDKELALLDQAWKDPATHVLMLWAWGGVGKTALVNHWLSRLEPERYRGAERVYGWSFNSQGAREDRQASADTFLSEAFRWFLETERPSKEEFAARIEEFKPKLPWDKGIALSKLIRRRRTLLILDGLEPLQHPPGTDGGTLRDQGVQALLKELARAGTDWGLCVVTTQLAVPELLEMKKTSVREVPLENLSDDAGARLLRNLGVAKGTDEELREAARDFKGHALALTLLGRYLAVVHDGEIRKRDLIPALADEEEKGGHAKRVMRSYEVWLKGKPELDVLHLLGLFDHPAEGGAVAELRREPVIEGLTSALRSLSEAHWKYALEHLRELRLLDPKDEVQPDLLDCHPLVREHFGGALKEKEPAAWKEAHSRLYEYYRKLPAKEFPDTLEEMEPLFRAVMHGCQAGRHQETFYDVWWRRIQRGNETYTMMKLGAIGANLAALSSFFEVPWSCPAVAITIGNARAAVLGDVGFLLRGVGRLREAREPMQAGLEMNVRQQDWENAARGAANLSELSLTLGEVKEAMDFAHRSVAYADQSHNAFLRHAMRTTLADALHQAGDLVEAERLFWEAEKMQQENQPEYPFLYSIRGYHFCDLLLSQCQFQEVRERVKKTLEWARQYLPILDKALDHLSLGRAALLHARVEGPFPLQAAARYLDQAVQGLREAEQQDDLPRGLLARAELHRVRGAFADAWRDLAETREIAERGGMRLFIADFHLEAARLAFALQNAKRNLPDEKDNVSDGKCKVPDEEFPGLLPGREHFATAQKMIAEMGYGRRKPDLAELARLLGDAP